MKIEHVELVRFQLPLVRPFRTSFGTQNHRDVILVHVITDAVCGRCRPVLQRGIHRCRL